MSAARRTVVVEAVRGAQPWWEIRCRPGCRDGGAMCMQFRSAGSQEPEMSCYIGGAVTRERAAAYAERLGYEVVA